EAEPAVAHWVARRTTAVLAEPRWGAEIRGRIDMGAPFAIYEMVEGKGCSGAGWARVGALGFACLRDAEVTKRQPKAQPPVPADRVVPFTYAKPRADAAGELLAPVPRYRNVAALAAGDAPVDWLQAHHQYAFIESRRVPGVGLVLLDRNRRAVRADAMELERPSHFAGRELDARPVPDGVVAAWSAEAPTPVRKAPGLEAAVVGQIPYHREIQVDPAPVEVDGLDWYALRGEPAGFVSEEDIRRWIPGAPLPGMRADETWIDVELSQQTLTLMRGQEPVFVTLISSGAGDNPTPRGIYRIWHKQALGDMRSLPGAVDSYTVEDVPWVQYFHRRFALHTAFWHNKFGRKRSHGCINLAPRDAARVFAATTPTMPPGWTFVYEHEEEAGTVVRIRKGTAPVPDRRRAIGDAPAAGEETADDEPARESADDDMAAP
ncbi:MAG TPA: L,D-transpeptidase, partial [Nannocystis sp.]